MSNNIIEKALMFASLAHSGQTRKGEPDKPYIVHPIAVAQILMEYGADNNVIAAGYLHDVVEDTNFSIKDIKKHFGDDIADLVECATEPDKSKSWEERKIHTINTIRELSLRKKLVIIADKINNAENLKRTFGKKGFKDFSNFKRGEEKQEWYYRNVYESLCANEDKDNILLKRLETAINDVFGRTMEEYNNIELER